MRVLVFMIVACLLCSSSWAETIALVVGNNLSLSSSRMDLALADDDAMQWGLFFQREIGEANTHIFTRKDKDSARLFSESEVSAPTWKALRAKAAVIGARPKGDFRELYFTFSGHGDVRQGKGYLELEDGPLTRKMLKELFALSQADRVHVVLDACHSFFILRPRGEGEKLTTISEASFVPDTLHPNMGVLISTNSEEVAYEWTPLGAGVFSHLARSALYGAGDVNLDGAMEYEEVQAFIETASSSIANPLYRPVVFAKAPPDKSPFLKRAAKAGVLIDIPERLSVRDAFGVRLMDVHTEPGFEPLLYLPKREGLSVFFEVTRRERSLENVNVLSTSRDLVTQLSARGPNMLETLFDTPFGPKAMAAKGAESDVQVLGISYHDRENIKRQLRRSSEMSQRNRYLSASAYGVYGILGPATLIAFSEERTSAGTLSLAITTGVVGLAMAGFSLAKTPAEKSWDSVVENADSLEVLLVQRDKLKKTAKRVRVIRYVTAGMFGAMSLAALGTYGVLERNPEFKDNRVVNSLPALSFALVPMAVLFATLDSSEESLVKNLEVE